MCHVVDVDGIYYHCKQRNLCCAVGLSAEILAGKRRWPFKYDENSGKLPEM